MEGNRPLIFYVDPSWKREGFQHIPLLYPFWGNALDASRTPFHHALFQRHQFDTTQYQLTDNVQEADMLLLPYSYNATMRVAPELIADVRAASAQYQLPVLVDGIGDVERKIEIPNAFVLRYGGYRFSKTERDIIIPPYSDDLLEVYADGVLPHHQMHPTAVVGFVGWARLSLVQELRTTIKELPDRLRGVFDSRYRAKKKGVFFRRHALALLSGRKDIATNFHIRAGYGGHVQTVSGDAERSRVEFVTALLQSDYGLDVRGDANASTRLFEMLSLGVIPIIVDTERNFPFRDEVDYASFSLMVDFRDIKNLPERIVAFHTSLTPEKYTLMRQRARDAYVRYFRVDALMRHITQELRRKLKTTEA